MAPFLMRVSASCSITRACWGPTSVGMMRTRTKLDSVASCGSKLQCSDFETGDIRSLIAGAAAQKPAGTTS